MASTSSSPTEQQASHKHKLRLKGPIGKGAFGQIYKGVLDGDIVAVKTLCADREANFTEQDGCGGGPSDDELFFKEAEVLRSCHHRRIIGFRYLMRMPPKDSKSQEPVWALVMEYAKNGNLGQRIAQQMTQPGRSSYSNTQAVSWALDIASSLEYLHLREPAVLHRDVKSANIMVTTEDGGPGMEVAKLSDFGLHVTADDSKHRALQSSGYSTNAVAVPSSGQGAAATAAVGLGSSSSSRASANSATQQQQQQQSDMPSAAAAPAAAAAATLAPAGGSGSLCDIYSEVHNSDGSRSCVQQPAPPASAAGPGAAARCLAAARSRVAQSNSFRRAIHHPPGEALPRLTVAGGVGGGVSTAPEVESVADANARLFAHMHSAGDGDGSSAGGGSMSSMITDGTWGRTDTVVSGTDTAGSDCTDDTFGSILDEVETVFNMTGRTGSCLYMAPEVFQAKQYNEKSDVFSFGVVLYELMARVLVVFTELPTNSSDPEIPQRYAAKVAGGYRPSRPRSKHMTDDMWALISACWQQDPVLRPHMSEVVSVLTKALSDETAKQLVSRTSRLSFSLTGRPSVQLPAATIAAARAASASAPAGISTINNNNNNGATTTATPSAVPACHDSAAGRAQADRDADKAAAVAADKGCSPPDGAAVMAQGNCKGQQPVPGVPAASQGCCVIC